jgi:hypothetical protein
MSRLKVDTVAPLLLPWWLHNDHLQTLLFDTVLDTPWPTESMVQPNMPSCDCTHMCGFPAQAANGMLVQVQRCVQLEQNTYRTEQVRSQLQ